MTTAPHLDPMPDIDDRCSRCGGEIADGAEIGMILSGPNPNKWHRHLEECQPRGRELVVDDFRGVFHVTVTPAQDAPAGTPHCELVMDRRCGSVTTLTVYRPTDRWTVGAPVEIDTRPIRV